ncbi:homing endonuclease associated repeat-containing protein [Haloarchaeobius sp. TZWSO28]|uniref:homing endonuclease associated repeat-containing protein n=1 Tax=Haloarchaeobius sp. TZWSO28 TaxID=3446119 RepID=UPI003EBD3618
MTAPEEPPLFSEMSIQMLIKRLRTIGADVDEVDTLLSRLETVYQNLTEVKQPLEAGDAERAAKAYTSYYREELPPVPEKISNEYASGTELAKRAYAAEETIEELGFKAFVNSAVAREEEADREDEPNSVFSEEAYKQASSYYSIAAHIASEAALEISVLKGTNLPEPEMTEISVIDSEAANELKEAGFESPRELSSKKGIVQATSMGENSAQSIIHAKENLVEEYINQQKKRVEKKREAPSTDEKQIVRETLDHVDETLGAAEEAISNDPVEATKYLDQVESRLDELSAENKQDFSEQLSLLEDWITELRERIQNERVHKQFGIAISRATKLEDEIQVAIDSNEKQKDLQVKEEATETLSATEEAIPDDLEGATKKLSQVEEALENRYIENERSLPEQLSPIEERLSEIRERVQTERVRKEFQTALSKTDKFLDEIKNATDGGEYSRAIGYTGPVRQQLTKAETFAEKLETDATEQIHSREERLDRLTEAVTQARQREDFEQQLRKVERTIAEGVEADAQEAFTEAARAYDEAYVSLEEALELAKAAAYPEEWELEQRLEQLESARRAALEQRDEDWERRCETAKTHISRATRELDRAGQHLDVGDDGAAYNSHQAAREAVEEARAVLQTGLVPSSRDIWEDVGASQARVDELADELSSRGIDRPMVSHDELLAYLKELAIIFNEPPSSQFVRNYGVYRVDEYVEVFGSWSDALEAANLDAVSSRQRRQYSRTDILDSILSVADELDRLPEKGDFNELGEMSTATVTKRFGTWEAAIALAGLTEEPALEVVRNHADGVEATRSDSGESSTSVRQRKTSEKDQAAKSEEDPESSDKPKTDFGGFRERRRKEERLKGSGTD